ncbi:MAG TPA: alcohol dehydrogenase catalytic domain-containing protein [Roseiflexaceae bacterium]|nr:alcohol dehydrogenase catalytic domain-containing protein [Roseiflexaceae bacterium]
MHALLFDGQLRLAEDYPAPELRPGEAIVRPHLVGICNTDIEITRGYMGFRGVLGHEFVGTVVACADPAWLGKRVVGEINAACGACAACARGDASHCPYRTTLGIDRRDGAMAQRFSLPISCLHEAPPGLPDEVAVFAEPVAAALEILQQSHLRPTDRVAVVGDGKLGILCAQALRLPGCAVTLVGRHPERWGWLHELGVETVHAGEVTNDQRPTTNNQPDPAGPDRSSFVVRRSSFDVVVECSGNPSGLATARRLVRPRGRLVLKSTFAAEAGLDLTMVVVDEVQLLGSRCGPFAPALRLLERGLIQVAPLIAGRFPLRDGVRAFQAAQRRLKILLEVEPDAD